MEIAIFTKLCVSLKFIPTNEPTNQLINLQISTVDLIQGFIGMRTLSAPNFLSQKKPSSADLHLVRYGSDDEAAALAEFLFCKACLGAKSIDRLGKKEYKEDWC